MAADDKRRREIMNEQKTFLHCKILMIIIDKFLLTVDYVVVLMIVALFPKAAVLRPNIRVRNGFPVVVVVVEVVENLPNIPNNNFA